MLRDGGFLAGRWRWAAGRCRRGGVMAGGLGSVRRRCSPFWGETGGQARDLERKARLGSGKKSVLATSTKNNG